MTDQTPATRAVREMTVAVHSTYILSGRELALLDYALERAQGLGLVGGYALVPGLGEVYRTEFEDLRLRFKRDA